jgi:hypothetical protein
MNLLDLRYIQSYSPRCEFDGDFDGGSYTINFHYKQSHCVHEKIEYTLRAEDYEELIDGLEYLLKILKKGN